MSFNYHPKTLPRNFGNETSASHLPYVPFPAHATYLHPFNNACTEYEDCDEPIDMSIKRKPETSHNDSEPYNSNRCKSFNSESSALPFSSTYSVSYLTRPSVITRFDSLHEHENLPPPPSYESANKDRSSKKLINVKNMLQTDNEKNSSAVKKKCDSVDPDIDEHFRRSLGINYNDFMVSENKTPVTEPCDSVDDHFTKALGPTWIKLKNEKKNLNSLNPGSGIEKNHSLTAVSNSDGHSSYLQNPMPSTVSGCSSFSVHNKLNSTSKSNCICSNSSCSDNVNNYYNDNNNLCSKHRKGIESDTSKSQSNFKLLY
ncbi:UNVERIFIED_CONTAM: hypothetical protein RMT77_017636 [Armadillidium vulgare]